MKTLILITVYYTNSHPGDLYRLKFIFHPTETDNLNGRKESIM